MPNNLIHTISPYLLQHAHNPVDWYPWGEEALQKAKRENKPILVSIGYSTCYWCHVMEREVFENKDIAKLMNTHFVNIKIDREERPDLDELYMTATQLILRQGGWPNNVFLTPDLQPFYAGTYFPPEDNPVAGVPGFPTVITKLHQIWQENPEQVRAEAAKLSGYIAQIISQKAPPTASLPDISITGTLYEYLGSHFDNRHGGFYQAPKFPNETLLLFLLEYAKHHPGSNALAMAKHSLDNIAAGGIYDQIGGGLHRYAVDKSWLVPHFEKMLYNQALIVQCYTALFSSTGQLYYQDIVSDTLHFVTTSMTSPEGGFYSAIDAETDATEGAYYVWTEAELKHALSPGEYDLLHQYTALEEIPHFPNHKHPDGKVLYLKTPLPQAAVQHGSEYPMLRPQLKPIYEALAKIRILRQHPSIDTKIIAGWNGLMIQAFAHAGMVFGNIEWIGAAKNACKCILYHLRDENGRLLRSFNKGKAHTPAFLEDYAYVVNGMLATYKASNETYYLEEALLLLTQANELFWDGEHGGYYFTDGKDTPITRIKNASDSALPSGNAAMAHALLDAYHLTADKNWYNKARGIFSAFSVAMQEFPGQYTHLNHAYLRFASLEHTVRSTMQEHLHFIHPEHDPKVKISIHTKPDTPKPGETFQIKITLAVDEGWHINAANAIEPHLTPTSVDVQSDNCNIAIMSVDYPAPVASLKGGHRVYVGRVSVPVTARIHPGTPKAHVKIRIRYQACADNFCSEPTDVALNLPIICEE